MPFIKHSVSISHADATPIRGFFISWVAGWMAGWLAKCNYQSPNLATLILLVDKTETPKTCSLWRSVIDQEWQNTFSSTQLFEANPK